MEGVVVEDGDRGSPTDGFVFRPSMAIKLAEAESAAEVLLAVDPVGAGNDVSAP